jgi:predicted GNAT family acetyltransferase
MSAFTDENALDNPVWSCLATRHAHLAKGGRLALRYRPEFSPLAGIPAAAAENVEALRDLVGVGEDLSVAGAYVPEPLADWETQQRIRIAQMIRRETAPLPEGGAQISVLSAADVGDMLALVDLTHPGPFRVRTIELGTFVGIRRHGQLLAMAGERMWVGNYREVSGICTHPDAQRRGLARALMGHVINRMLSAGQTPFLHVDSSNERVIALYEALGFVRRAVFPLVHAKRIR